MEYGGIKKVSIALNRRSALGGVVVLASGAVLGRGGRGGFLAAVVLVGCPLNDGGWRGELVVLEEDRGVRGSLNVG
jgi:hypothetical protein